MGWWGVLLYQKNSELYADKTIIAKLLTADESHLESIKEQKKRQSTMIIGEGLVLGLSLLAGLWIINRSAKKELATVNNQNNFLLSVSHELKSPIAAIKLAMQTLQRRNIPEEAKENLLNKAILDVNRLENMVQNVLLSATIDNQKIQLYLEEFDIVELINSKIRHALSVSPGTIILFHNKENQIILKADKNGIEQVLSNLIENAIKYSSAPITLDIDLIKKEGYIEVHVKDQGIGIPDQYKELVFDRFYRVTERDVRSQKGSGLGLYISKEIIEAHHGSLLVTDNVPCGSILTFKLPFNGA